MRRPFLPACFFLVIVVAPAFACWCGPPGPASQYVGNASAVFIGVVAFTDDDGSGKFTQKTFVRFTVEESYKGLGPDDRDVWVDPDSFTSCYATYRVGERYLVFAYKDARAPQDTLGISVVRPPQSSTKPLPPGMDPKNLPTVYFAPECSGTRRIALPTKNDVSPDIAYLRKYKTETEKAAARK